MGVAELILTTSREKITLSLQMSPVKPVRYLFYYIKCCESIHTFHLSRVEADKKLALSCPEWCQSHPGPQCSIWGQIPE